MIKVEWFYWLCALFFLVISAIRLRDTSDRKRVGSAGFWAILAFTFVYGTFVVNKTGSALIEGIAVISLAVLAGLGFPGRGTDRTTDETFRAAAARRFGSRLLIPALVIPAGAAIFAVLGIFQVKVGGRLLLEQGMATIIGLGIAALLALVVAMVLFGEKRISVPFTEGDRLLGHIGWAAILPQFLATLGLLFNQAGVGKAVGRLTGQILPSGSLFLAVLIYCLGMAIFTIIMGNAFAAFPVMTAAVGWPVLVQLYHGNPASLFAIGMLAGFCGTLCTPMAANFNLVPAALLELKDQYGPIKAQLPSAGLIFICNTLLMYFLCFPRGA